MKTRIIGRYSFDPYLGVRVKWAASNSRSGSTFYSIGAAIESYIFWSME